MTTREFAMAQSSEEQHRDESDKENGEKGKGVKA
jgi:hypothetical protein